MPSDNTTVNGLSDSITFLPYMLVSTFSAMPTAVAESGTFVDVGTEVWTTEEGARLDRPIAIRSKGKRGIALMLSILHFLLRVPVLVAPLPRALDLLFPTRIPDARPLGAGPVFDLRLHNQDCGCPSLGFSRAGSDTL